MLSRGALITLARDINGYAVWFGTYQATKTWILSLSEHPETTALSPGAILLAGASAGWCQWTLVLPLDTLKTLYQSQTGPRTGVKTVMQLFALHRHRLYRGYWLAVARASFSNAIAWLGTEYAYEYLMRYR
jgi:hypothetical protein